MKKVMLVFGTRSEAIKICPLVNELKKRSGIKAIVCVTAQHRQMLDRAYEILNSERERSIKYLLDSLEKTEASMYL